LDYGYAQITEPDALKLWVTQKGEISAEKARLSFSIEKRVILFCLPKIFQLTFWRAECRVPSAECQFSPPSPAKSNCLLFSLFAKPQLQKNLTKITARTTGAMLWRGDDIKYKKNEVYLDVIESVNLLMSTQGNILQADVSGKIVMKAYLTGMPECKFGINDRLLLANEAKVGKARTARANGIALEDVTLHPCVRLGKFESERTVSFVPPDGEFELMSYRITENIQLPFKVISNVKETGRNRLEAEVTVKSYYPSALFSTHVKIVIPTPKNTAVCKCVIKGGGKAKYNSDVGGILWKISRFPGQTEAVLRASIELLASSTLEEKAWSRPPISMEFQVPMFAASGLSIRYLRVVEKSGYETIKWVRYLTKGGNYLHRI
jgi:AP-2 complex subunit mu-1